jgi:hypothetical protein
VDVSGHVQRLLAQNLTGKGDPAFDAHHPSGPQSQSGTEISIVIFRGSIRLRNSGADYPHALPLKRRQHFIGRTGVGNEYVNLVGRTNEGRAYLAQLA